MSARPAAALVLGLFLGAAPVASQSTEPTDTSTAPDAESRPATASPAPRSWLILPTLFYTPETDVGGGVAVGHYPGGGTGRRPSSVLAILTVTSRRQAIAQVVPDLYLAGGRTRLQGEIRAQEFPDFFYGIGTGTPTSAEEPYTARTFVADVTARREVATDLWIGGRALLRHDELTEVEEGGLLDAGAVIGAAGGTTAGVGLSALLDTRDSPFATRSGQLLEGVLTTFAPELGGDYRFTSLRLDARSFRPLAPEVVLALRGVAEATWGDAPFPLLPRVGGGNLLRGYRDGRFRDDRMAVAQAELRFPIWRRLGGAVFGAVGDVASSWSDFPAPSDLERSVGVGLRFRLTEGGVNLRADWAEGRGTRGLYMGFGDAF